MKRFKKPAYLESVEQIESHKEAYYEGVLVAPVNLPELAKVHITDLLYRRLPLLAFKQLTHAKDWIENFLFYDNNIVCLRGTYVEFHLEGQNLLFSEGPATQSVTYYYYYPEFKPGKEIYPVKNFNMLPSLYGKCEAIVSTSGTHRLHFALRNQAEAELWLKKHYPAISKDNVHLPHINDQLIPTYQMLY